MTPRLLFVTQILDEEDPVLGFVVGWVRALAKVTDVSVIANQVGRVPEDLARSVTSLGKEHGASRLKRGLRYQHALWHEVRGNRPAALFAHMCPIYLNQAAPIAGIHGVRLLLWFAHPSRSRTLALAQRLADTVLTSFEEAYPLSTPKLNVIGQGIDVDRIPFDPRPPSNGSLRLIAIGRTSPVKKFPVAIRAVAELRGRGVPVSLRIIGPSTTSEERHHRAELVSLIRSLHATGFVAVEQGVPPRNIIPILDQADVLVNTVVAGSGDKVVLEAAARGKLVLASNPVLRPLLGVSPIPLTFPEDGVADLATAIERLTSVSHTAWIDASRALRTQVEREHSLRSWARKVVALAV